MNRKFKIGQEIEVCGVRFVVFYSGYYVKCLAKDEKDFHIPDEGLRWIMRQVGWWNGLEKISDNFRKKLEKDPVTKWMKNRGKSVYYRMVQQFRFPNLQEYVYFIGCTNKDIPSRFVTADHHFEENTVFVAGNHNIEIQKVGETYDFKLLPLCEFRTAELSDYLNAQEQMRREAKSEVDRVLQKYGFKEYVDLEKIAD